MQTTITTYTVQGEPMIINIRLSDPCNNGYNDFAITADIYRKGSKKLIDRNMDRCGCCHEDILAKKPSLKIFVDLHLSDESGAPMFVVENGFYHLEGVQGVAAYGHKMNIDEFAQYIRVSKSSAVRMVNDIHTKEQFAAVVDTLRPLWKAEADAAKEILANMIEKETVTEKHP